MNIQEILTQAQQSCDAVKNLLIELDQQNKEVTAAAQKACSLYFADVQLRKNGIQDKVAALEKQNTELDAQIRGMQATIVDAAGTGDADVFSKAQDKLTAIEARKSAISTQISMLQAAYVRGSDEVYRAACDAQSVLHEANSVYADTLKAINSIVKTWSELDEKSKPEKCIRSGSDYSYRKMWENYNKKPEAPQKPAVEEKVRNLETGRFIIGGSVNMDKGPRFEPPTSGGNGPR